MINWDAAITPPTAEEESKAAARAAAENYLDSTDKYVIRSLETGEAVPEEISSAREAARATLRLP